MSEPTVEYGVRCADGTQWDDTCSDLGMAVRWTQEGDTGCGCEAAGHVVVSRVLSPWRDLGDRAQATT